VSMATDGLDAESALQAAGVGSSENLDAFSVGRALFEMLDREPERAPVLTKAPPQAVRPEPSAAVRSHQLSLF